MGFDCRCMSMDDYLEEFRQAINENARPHHGLPDSLLVVTATYNGNSGLDMAARFNPELQFRDSCQCMLRL